ncbi:MAG: NAD(+)/NADH kinase [Ruminococcus sp.]|nr:NAD(+)/NADH kinase [Ruminococcus sp.]
MNIALIVNFDKPNSADTAERIIAILCKEGISVYMLSENKVKFSHRDVTYLQSYEELFSVADAAVTVGGDGTIIHSARYAAKMSKPILGVNMGRIGYVAELEPSEISMLKELANGNFSIMNRMLLGVEVLHADGSAEEYIAVNDAVISRGALSRMTELEVCAGSERILCYRADGLLFSTPTGSTAYALSAGGPVIDPALSLIELTPVCPHSLTARTVLFTDDTVLEVKSRNGDTAYLTVDGQISVALDFSDKVKIFRSEYTLSMITMKEKNFYKLAGEKLKEGI